MFQIQKHANIIAGGILLWFFIVSLIVSGQESTTMDEQAHIPSAYTYVKYHDMRLNPEHPPLIKILSGWPLLFMDVHFPINDPHWQKGVNEQWTLGNKFIHSNRAEAITFWSRFPIILVGMLLGWFIFRWTKEWVGTTAALTALIIYAFNPNILGHSHYVTTDIGIAAFIFFAFYYFLKFIKNPSWKNVLLAGFFLGLAEAAKFSAVLLFPYFVLIGIIYALFSRRPSSFKISRFNPLNSFIEYAIKYSAIVTICFAVLWVIYVYTTYNMPLEKVTDIANTVFSDEGSGKLAKATVIWMTQVPILKYLSEYFLGVFMVFARINGGNTYYFLGQVSNQATPLYFPVVYLLKETLPLLFLILGASGYALWNFFKNLSKGKNFWKDNCRKVSAYLRNGVIQYSMLGFVILYSYLSITGNLNIGLRHLFPILPFIYVLTTKVIFDARKKIIHSNDRLIFNSILTFALIWIILEPIIFFPSYLSYFNEITGGPKNGYKFVTDSNYDWGQDLKRLSLWVEKYNEENPNDPITKIRIDYFGGSNPTYYLREKFIPWHSDNVPEKGWYAISVGFLQEDTHKKKSPGQKGYEWLSSQTPYARVGDSIFIYKID